MTDVKKAPSLPKYIGDETIISLENAVAAVKKDARKPTGFERHELRAGECLYELGKAPDAIYMLRAGAIRLMAAADRPIGAMPITVRYEAVPKGGSERPLLGARYYFSRTPCTLQYFAETPCSLYRITSTALNDLHDADREAVIMIMYWLIACSDISDVFIPIVNKALGLEQTAITDTKVLFRAVEEFRASRNDPKMLDLLYKLYKNFMSRRIDRAKALGIEPSLVPHAPVR